MVDVNEEVTRKIADLARVELTENEVKTFTAQIQLVLSHIDEIQKVDVMRNGKPVPPMNHPLELETPMREDVPRPFPKSEDGKPRVLESAPDSLYDGYKVPQIV